MNHQGTSLGAIDFRAVEVAWLLFLALWTMLLLLFPEIIVLGE